MYLNGYLSQQKQSSGESVSRTAVPLLDPAQLLLAISGRSTSTAPLVRWARELGDIHAGLIPLKIGPQSHRNDVSYLRGHAEVDRIISEIDAWALRQVPRAKCARKHTHSLGEVVSHVAKTYAHAWWVMLHTADGELQHKAWFHVSEVREGYAEMLNEIRAHHLQLPSGAIDIRIIEREGNGPHGGAA
ncbi:hypothetical protein IU427_26430 [Nocardia beijingensis]|uniref:hypothetical protein n=1 Tax=Nocardia beijingensis TaxID=95162 RepID=UPI0018954A8D|nr:hypothetical protein [Nocardia beijingensis]MBF6468673.1 hypothetical protein [Nocardia beijingensis]